jgi:type I restriction enzyme R subunit
LEIEPINQGEIDVDDILMRDGKGIRAEISRAVDSSPSLRNKKDLTENFVDNLRVDGSIDEEWRHFTSDRCDTELDAIIQDEKPHPDRTRTFVEAALRSCSQLPASPRMVDRARRATCPDQTNRLL